MSKKPSTILRIELVPATSWGANLRRVLTVGQWDKVRRHTYRQARYRCEICGGRGPRHPVECHEVWHYDDHKKIQTLKRCIALCPACHRVKHFGRTSMYSDPGSAIKHMMQVNGWTREQTRQHIADAFIEWEQRSQYEWTLDLSWLEKFDG